MEPDAAVLRTIVSAALAEDIGEGDITSRALIGESAKGSAALVSRGVGVLAGVPVAEAVFREVSSAIEFRRLLADGSRLKEGSRIAELSGPMRDLLAGERVALNFLQRLSGIATLTDHCVEAVRPYGCRILDTRKTTPGLRRLEKYAVRMGGGTNHRMGLYDRVLIKDNHLQALRAETGDMVKAVKLAVRRAREAVHAGVPVEVEAEDEAMVAAAIEAGADIIMLDNMDPAAMRRAAALVRDHRTEHGTSHPTTEASGGVKLGQLQAIAETGVDAISLGMLTHSAPALDIAMEVAETG